jgi:flagellar biosynthesis chaperone FliJ
MSDTELTETQATAQELAEAIADLEQYRERLVNDTLAMAQRAKVMRATALSNLEPELGKIDATIQALRDQQTALTATN